MVIARWYRELSEPRETVLAALQAEEGVADTAELLRAAEDLVLAFPKVLKNAERNAALDVAVAAVHAGDSEQSVEFRAVQAQHAADHQTTATCARWLVSRRPTNAKYHLWLGAALGRCGDLERGIQECRIADQLVDGGWLLAAAEVGILLLEAERPYDAVMAFEECSTRVHAEQDGAVAVHVLYHHAEALLRTGRTLDAVALLRRARALESRHAPTAERLAHALLLIGEHREGLAMAKEAAHLGLRDILAAFERGEYGRSPGGAQTH
jgi:tetratricopeptide (TPR) repeat protein